MSSQPVHIQIDNRIRLFSAALAATTWPESEQTQHRFRPHVHARGTARRLAPLADHPAVQELQRLLDAGIPLRTLYGYALGLPWPEIAAADAPVWSDPAWPVALADFAASAALDAWWEAEQPAWDIACEQAAKVVTGVDLAGFFAAFFGPPAEHLILMPNISFPGEETIGLRHEGALWCVAPPRIAWGDNEPWPFDEDPAHLFRAAVTEYGRLLASAHLVRRAPAHLNGHAAGLDQPANGGLPRWVAQMAELFVAGAVVLFFEDALDPQEARAYLLMEQRTNGARLLPHVVAALRRYRDGHAGGRYADFGAYLPEFAAHLRAARETLSTP